MIDYKYRDLFIKDNIDKQAKIEYGGVVIDNEHLFQNSEELTENLCTEKELRFGTCEASCFKFKVANIAKPLIGDWITYSIVLNHHDDNPFLIGKYKVASDNMTADRRYREIIAYDIMHDILCADVAGWYNSVFPNKDSRIKMRDFRSSFAQHFNLQEVLPDEGLINDDMTIEKTIDPSEISGKDVITAICEINGCFGHIGRDGKFHYVYLEQDIGGLYPSDDLFPDHAPEHLAQSKTGHLYPQNPNSTKINTGLCISKKAENYLCKKITKVQIRKEENDIGGIYPEKEVDNLNKYVIEDNFLVYGKSSEELKIIAKNIYSKITNVIYRPFTAECVGNPCIEVGDAIRIPGRYILIESYVLSRVLKGVQSLRDSYSTNGVEEYPEKVNSVRRSIIQLKGKTNTLVRSVEETRLEMKDVEEGLSNTIAATAESLDVEIKNTKQGLESKINVNTRSIEAEVNRAINEEGKLSGRLELEAERITAEVTRATQEEGKLSGKLEIEAGHIEAEVSRATSAEGKLSGRISIAEQNIELKVSKGNVSSAISLEPDNVEIRSNRLIVESSQFKLDRNGNAEFGGNLKAATGTFFGTITSDNGTYYAKITNASMQGGRSGEDVTGYVSFNSEYRNTGVSGTRLSGKGIVAIYTPYLGVGDWTKFEDEGLVYIGQTDSTTVVTGLEFDENGIVKSYSTKTISFQKGLMTTVLN